MEEAGRSSPRDLEECGFQTPSLQNFQNMHFCCFTPPSLWSLVTAPTGALREKMGFLGPGIIH